MRPRRPGTRTPCHGVTTSSGARGPRAATRGRGPARRRVTATCSPPGTAPYASGSAPAPATRGSAATGATSGCVELVDVPGRVRPVAAHVAGTRGPAPTSRGGGLGERHHRPPRAPTRSWAARGVERDQARGRSARSTRSPRPSSSTNRNRPGSAASARVAHSSRRRARGDGRRSARPPASPVCGETITLRTSSWVRDGSSPVASIAVDAPRREARRPRPAGARSWRLARPVRCTSPSPYVLATSPSAASDARGRAGRRSAGAGPARRRRPARGGATPGQRSLASRGWSHGHLVLRGQGPVRGARGDLAAVAARASRSSDSGSSGAERLPGASLQWLPPWQSGVPRPSPIPLRVSPGLSPGSLTPSGMEYDWQGETTDLRTRRRIAHRPARVCASVRLLEISRGHPHRWSLP